LLKDLLFPSVGRNTQSNIPDFPSSHGRVHHGYPGRETLYLLLKPSSVGAILKEARKPSKAFESPICDFQCLISKWFFIEKFPS
jgi:hypothetical protein